MSSWSISHKAKISRRKTSRSNNEEAKEIDFAQIELKELQIVNYIVEEVKDGGKNVEVNDNDSIIPSESNGLVEKNPMV